MKYVLATYKQKDGEHEYAEHLIIKGQTLEEIRKLAEQQEFDYGDDTEPMQFFSYGDGETSCELSDDLIEITEEEAILFHKRGLCYFLN